MNLYLNLQTATKIVFILVTCVAFSGAALQNDDLQNKDKNKPNIIIILADDLGFNDVSIHGSNQIPTPNIDALGIMGIQLNQMYAAPMCTPSRSSLLTGKYPSNLGMQHSVISSDEPFGLDPNETTMADYMKSAGYQTYLVGKWHLGFFEKRYTPLYRGFDSHFGYYGGFIDYFNHSLTVTGKNFSNGFDMRKNLTVNWDVRGQYATDLFTKEAVETINNHNKSAPMFMMITHVAVHTGNDYDPMQAPEEEIKKFSYIKDIKRQKYAAMLSKLDESVGKVVAALEKNKMLETSVILFMADNGAPVEGTYANSGSNFPFKGQKNSPWEGAVRSAAAIWSTQLKKRQRVSNQRVHITDWLPTFAKIADFALSNSIDGRDVWEALSYNLPSPRGEVLVHHDAATPYMSYISDDYKLVSGSTSNGTYDRWLSEPIDPAQQNATFADNYGQAILTSAVGQVLSKYSNMVENPFQPIGQNDRGTITEEEINKIRANAIITCNGHSISPNNNSVETCNPIIASCLFDIVNDPCETTNLASQYPDIVMELQSKLNYYGKIALPNRKKPSDPRCDPANFGGIWTWWYDELKVSPPTVSGSMKLEKCSTFICICVFFYAWTRRIMRN